MERLYYSLRIRTNELNYNEVSRILQKQPNDSSKGWIFEVEIYDDSYFNFIDEFLDVLEGHYEELENIGILRRDITIWLIYGYNQQCNLEFAPIDLERLGKNGITLCLSCYEIGEAINRN